MCDASAVPQWKRELIARLRRRSAVSSRPPERCDAMVQAQDSDSDSSEELRYGPGIVSRLKNKYLSLALRERPAALRRAASLEDVLEEEAPPPRPNRAAARGSDMKRARSVETISRGKEREPKEDKGAEARQESKCGRVNRPRRIAPVMNEREKPPADVVKQAKLIFEGRPEQRTKPRTQTGDVAAKVATYKNIIASKKPPIKLKPILLNDKPKSGFARGKKRDFEVKSPDLPSPIPDISRSDEITPKITNLSETPDLIMTSSPLSSINSPSFRISATENFIKEEIRLASEDVAIKENGDVFEEGGGVKKLTAKIDVPNTVTFNFANNNKNKSQPNHLPVVNRNVLNAHVSPLQPLKLEINGVTETKNKEVVKTSPAKPNLTVLEIEKNLINAAKTLEQPNKSCVSITCNEEVTRIKVPKVKKQHQQPKEAENNSVVFKFTDRKDVPDYVQNDGVKRVVKIEKPKVGEGGIILLPGASIDESFTDEDEEILRSLEGPPSPCDVTFVNDNVLIDGKSSLSQKTKRAKLRISFVEAGPDIYEYPSETSLLIEEVPTSPVSAQIRHSVPSLSGSSALGNYTPKSTEDFQPGVTRSIQNIPNKTDIPDSTSELILQEVEEPIMFSAGANSDILF